MGELFGPMSPSEDMCARYFDSECIGCPIADECNAPHPPTMSDSEWKARDRMMDAAARRMIDENR